MSISLVAATALIALVATWPLFLLLDRASVRQIARHRDLDEDDAKPLAVFLGVVRTIALLVSLVAVPVVVLIVSMAPIVVAISAVVLLVSTVRIGESSSAPRCGQKMASRHVDLTPASKPKPPCWATKRSPTTGRPAAGQRAVKARH
jgi:hypothetical protein